MNSAIVAAIKHQNYDEAARLITALPTDNPWKQLHQGQLHEAQSAWDLAETAYRETLRQSAVPKLTLAARQGLQRLSEQAAAAQALAHQTQLAATLAQPGQDQPGILVIAAVPSDQKAGLAPKFAQIMHCDPYAARMLLPSRGYRLYRSGTIGELQVFGQELQAAGIPVTWHPLTDIQKIQVIQVSYFDTLTDPAQVQIAHPGDGPQSFSWQWSDVSQRVQSLIPIFEEVVDRDQRGKIKRREETQDHAQCFDLHLPRRNCILRFYDSAYQFHHGIPLAPIPLSESQGSALDKETSWANWRALITTVEQQLPKIPTHNDFDPFANTALDHPETLDKLNPHINLFRRTDSRWDPAFHLYSSLLFLKAQRDLSSEQP